MAGAPGSERLDSGRPLEPAACLRPAYWTAGYGNLAYCIRRLAHCGRVPDTVIRFALGGSSSQPHSPTRSPLQVL